jgi:hypothetical protein
MSSRSHLRLVTALGRRLDGAVCAGSIANAARSVYQNEQRASQRRDAHAAIQELEQRVGREVTSSRTRSRQFG